MTESKSGKRGLGRGLSALMADVQPAMSETTSAPREKVVHAVPIEMLFANPNQPRREFKEDDLRELAASIREKGVLQPLIVRKHPTKTNSYEIVAGERRWRAAQMSHQHSVPVILRNYSDDEVLEIAIIENVQRADLNPVEEARGYRQLMDRFGHTQVKLAEGLSKSRSHIANMLRLLHLPDDVLDLVTSGKLTTGHARALITSENPSALAREIVSRGLSVRETEALVKAPKGKAKTKATKAAKTKDADTRALENDLAANIKMKVSIDHSGMDGSGKVTISYKNLDELDEVCRLLSSGV
jgi:ParB family chromosome partitioning protein